MNPYSLIAICSLAISVLTFILMQMGHKHTVAVDTVAGLETRIKRLEEELETANKHFQQCEEQYARLLKENIEIMRRLAKMG